MTELNHQKETSEEKTTRILQMLTDGQTREEVGEYYKQPWKTIDMHMRRQGYKWDKHAQMYVIKEEKHIATDDAMLVDQTKAGNIARQFQAKYPDARQIAQKQGFESVEQMGKYMETEGYIWNDDINGYELAQSLMVETEKQPIAPKRNTMPQTNITTTENVILSDQEMMSFLLKHQAQLQKLLTPNTAEDLPTLRFKGKGSNKTFTMVDVLHVLVDDYKAQYNVTHRMIIEVALNDFFEKYGFAHRIADVKY